MSQSPLALYISLRGSERRVLRRVVAAHTSEQRDVLRARIVLLAASGANNSKIAHELDCDVKTVRKWRGRFVVDRLEGLWDAPRSGRPPEFTASQRHEVFAAVVGPPPQPFARWTCDRLADHLVDSGIVTYIGRETVSLWLRTADVKPHRVRYWLTSRDPAFVEKKKQIIDLYLNRPTDGIVICVDEKTCIQALERKPCKAALRPGRGQRVEFEYKRRGVVNLIAAFAVHTGRVLGECVDRNDSAAFIKFLQRIMKAHPRRKIYLVMDNGTTHTSHETTAFLAAHSRVIPVFTPTHASWLNQVEIWFSLLSREALRHVSFRTREELRERIFHYIEVYNSDAGPFQWTSHGRPLVGPTKTATAPAWGTPRRQSSPRGIRRADHYPEPTTRTPLGSK